MDQKSRNLTEAMNAYYGRDNGALERLITRMEEEIRNPKPSNIEVHLPEGDKRKVDVVFIDRKADGTRQVCITVSREDQE
jgi:hypothetical protein